MREALRIWILALWIAGPGFAQDNPEPVPKTELQKFHHAMREISAQITNAGAKLRSGAVSMGDRSGRAVGTPAKECCANNIDKIEQRIRALGAGIENLRSCYAGIEDVDAQVHVNLVYQDTASLYRALNNFRGAGSDRLVEGYGAMMRSYILLEKSARELKECPAVR